jgi:hypothetical protein
MTGGSVLSKIQLEIVCSSQALFGAQCNHYLVALYKVITQFLFNSFYLIKSNNVMK